MGKTWKNEEAEIVSDQEITLCFRMTGYVEDEKTYGPAEDCHQGSEENDGELVAIEVAGLKLYRHSSMARLFDALAEEAGMAERVRDWRPEGE